MSNWCAIVVLSSRQAAMAKPVNGPVFGARNDEMGIVFAAFKPPAGKFEEPVKNEPATDKRRMNSRFRIRSASAR